MRSRAAVAVFLVHRDEKPSKSAGDVRVGRIRLHDDVFAQNFGQVLRKMIRIFRDRDGKHFGHRRSPLLI